MEISEALYRDIQQYIESHIMESINFDSVEYCIPISNSISVHSGPRFDMLRQLPYDDLEIKLEKLDEGFRDMLFRKIDEFGMTDAECYKKAQLTRSHFNKIKNDRDYNPKKATVVALAFALELPQDEFFDFVSKAGYSISRSNIFDLIVRYAISHEIYDLYTVNAILLRFDQQLLEGVLTIKDLFAKGVKVNILNMGIIEDTLNGKLILTVLLAFAEYERGMIVERSQSGKAIARQNPNFREGRPKKYGVQQIAHVFELLSNGNTYSEVEALTGISKSTLVRAKKA